MEHESFTLTDHGMKQPGMVVGYHCPICAEIYSWGRYTLENSEHILGQQETFTCCGKEHPLPMVWQDLEEAREFMYYRSSKVEATVIQKSGLIIAHFDLEHFLKKLKRSIQ